MSNKMKYVFIVLSIISILTCVAVPVLAKYIKEKENELEIRAKKFYFTSDLLEEPSTHVAIPEYMLGKGVNVISFTLNNFEDDLRFTTSDIKYEMIVVDSNNFTVYDKTGTITGGNEKQSVSFNTPELVAGTYIVTVESTFPYSKCLKAKFIVQEIDENITYTVSDGVSSTVVMLTISVNDYSGNINIKWPNGVSPDNSDPLLSGAINCDNYTVYFNSYSEYTFVFFKNDSSKVYSDTDFVVSK